MGRGRDPVEHLELGEQEGGGCGEDCGGQEHQAQVAQVGPQESFLRAPDQGGLIGEEAQFVEMRGHAAFGLENGFGRGEAAEEPEHGGAQQQTEGGQAQQGGERRETNLEIPRSSR